MRQFLLLSFLCSCILPELRSQCTISPYINQDTLVCSGGSVVLTAEANRGLQLSSASDQYIQMNAAAQSLSGSDFSFSAWIRTGSVGGNIFAVNTSSGDNRILFLVQPDGLLALYDGTNRTASVTAVNDMQWHHVAYTYVVSSKTAQVYVDGVLESTLNLSGMPSGAISSTDRVSIAQEWDTDNPSGFFNGTVDEVRIWDKSISGTEISAWMNKEIDPTHPDYANLVGYFHLNQENGSKTFSALNNPAFEGNLVNNPAWVSVSNPSFISNAAYSWDSDPAGITASTASFATTVTETTTFTVTVTDDNGCTGTAVRKVVVPELPALDISSNSPVCENTMLQLSDAHGPGTGLSFDGTNDWVEIDALSDDISGSDFSISFWMKNPGGSGDVFIFSVNTSSNDNRLLLGLRRSTGQLFVYQSGRFATSIVNDDKWHHVTLTFDNALGKAALYVDGGFQFSFPVQGLTIAATDKIAIGQEWDTGGPSDFFNGQIDELRVWSESLSQNEIISLMLAELPVSEYSRLYGYYKFNEGTGTTVNDLSGNNNNGNLKNGTSTASGPIWVDAGWRSHSWSGPDGFTSMVSDPLIPSVTSAAAGTYDVDVSVFGCNVLSTSETVAIDPVLTKPSIDPADPFCQNSAASDIMVDVSGGIWSGTGIVSASAGTFDPSVAGIGKHEVIYTYTGGNGCEGKDTTFVRVYPEPEIDISEDRVICPGNTVDLSAECNFTASFNGASYIDFDAAAPELAGKDLSFSTYLKSSQTAGVQSLLSFNTETGGNRLLFKFHGPDGLLYFFDGANKVASITPVNDDNWHYVAFSYDVTTKEANVYVDNVLEATLTLSGMPATGIYPTDMVSIGQEWDNASASDFLTGTLEESRIWSAKLSQTEFADWYNMELNSSHPQFQNLEVYFNYNNPGSVIYDHSVNFFNGSVNGSISSPQADIPGFVSPCTYSWSSTPAGFSSTDQAISVSPSEITEYEVTVVTTGGCSISSSVSVGQIEVEAPELTSNSPVCEGDDLFLYDLSGAGNSFYFDGVNDWVEWNSLADDIHNSDFTFSAWVRDIPGTGNHGIFAANVPSSFVNTLVLAVEQSSGNVIIYDDQVIKTFPDTKMNDGEWHHVAITVDIAVSEVVLYIDGINSGSIIMDNLPATGINTSDRISIGQEYDDASITDHFNGNIDEVRLWTRKLSSDDIRTWMSRRVNNTHPYFPDLKGYFTFEGSGNTVTDESGNNNSGLRKNGTTTTSGPVSQTESWRTSAWAGPNGFISSSSDPVINSVTQAAAGDYSLQVTVHGCTSIASTTAVNVKPPVLDPTVSPAGPFCFSEDPVILTAASSGGTWTGNGITDQFSGEFNPSEAGGGTHKIIYTANDCAANKDSIEIVVYDEVQITPGGTIEICEGDDVALTSNQSSGNLWSTTETTESITVNTQGEIILEIDYGVCSDHDTVEIIVNELPDLAVSSINASCGSCSDGTMGVDAIGGSGGYVYSWTASSCTTADCYNVPPGDYQVCVTDSKGCTACADITVDFVTGNASVVSDMTEIYPNPTTGPVYINSENVMEIEVLDANGKIIEAYQVNGKESVNIDLSGKARGLYLIILKTRDHNIITNRILVE